MTPNNNVLFDQLVEVKRNGIYHYTDIEGLFGIVKNQCLFASHIKFLNDWKEFDVGYTRILKKLKNCISPWEVNRNSSKELNEIFDEIKKIPAAPSDDNSKKVIQTISDCFIYYGLSRLTSNVYAISFCEDRDNLNNWITYAKENGVSIEFDFSEHEFYDYALTEKEDLAQKFNDIKLIARYPEISPRKVKYISRYGSLPIEITKYIEQMFTEINKLKKDKTTAFPRAWQYVENLIGLAPYLKAKEFNSEREARIAFREWEAPVEDKEGNSLVISTAVNYRTRNDLIIPFLKIGWLPNRSALYPIKSVTVGPGKSQKATFDSIFYFLDNQPEAIIPVCQNPEEKLKSAKGKRITRNGIVVALSDTSYIF